MVTNCTPEAIHSLKDFAKKRSRYSETKYAPLSEKLSKLSDSELEHIHYHKECYKLVVYKGMLERAEKRFCETSTSELQMHPAKAGRPSTTQVDAFAGHLHQNTQF